MKTNIIAVGGISLLVLFIVGFVSIFEIRLAAAQVDATSSLPSSTDATNTLPDLVASTSTALIADIASSSPGATSGNEATTTIGTADSASATTVATSAPSVSTPAVEPPPKGLAKVHIIGTKYTDYFTDGKTVTAFPGDPAIDSHFDVPNAPIPTHEGLTWDHTSGGYLYDTPSGDLELGDYATQPNGSYIENAPPFVSSTSTPTQTATSTTTAQTSSIPPSNSAAASTSSTASTSPKSGNSTTEAATTDTASTTPSAAFPSVPTSSTSGTSAGTGTDASSSSSL